MYRAITFSMRRLGESAPDGISAHAYPFRGFDGNEETVEWVYARYLIYDLGKWRELKETDEDGLNSHGSGPGLDGYRRMLKVWQGTYGDRFKLSSEQIRAIVEAVARR